MGNEKERYPKAKFRMCITSMKQVEAEDGHKTYVPTKSKWLKYSGKKFREDFLESKSEGENLSIEVVTAKPEQFKLNQIYMLMNREVVWVWTEDKD